MSVDQSINEIIEACAKIAERRRVIDAMKGIVAVPPLASEIAAEIRKLKS